MVMARKYQLRETVKGRPLCFVGTEAIAMTSLNEMIWTAVMTMRM